MGHPCVHGCLRASSVMDPNVPRGSTGAPKISNLQIQSGIPRGQNDAPGLAWTPKIPYGAVTCEEGSASTLGVIYRSKFDLAWHTAEGVTAPLLMVRRGPHKLITGPEDPPLLFDLDADPDETRNLAEEPGAAEVRAELEAVAARTWDAPALDRAVRETQAARRLVGGALATGARRSWDYQPLRDASKSYYREGGDVQDAYSGRIG